jgi:predicted kinase
MGVNVRPTPALRRLEWLLDGLDGQAGWGSDVTEVLAPEFLKLLSPAVFVDTYRRRSEQFAPVSVRLVEAGDHAARADILDRAGQVSVLHCQVEHSEPYRITRCWLAPLVPEGLAPRLPLDFTGRQFPDHPAGARLVVLSGVPGSGKSTIAEVVGRELGAPVFAMDWLLGALTPFGGRHFDQTSEIAAELLTTLAFRQLVAGQSAVLDSPSEDIATRHRWITLAAATGARLRVVSCVCSDRELHRARVEERRRDIPGWHEAADWTDVLERLSGFVGWPIDVLTVDTSQPLAACASEVLSYARA